MRRRQNISTIFNDLLFNALLGFFVLLLLSLALIKPESKKNEIQLKAEYLISIQWPDKSNDDVDILMKTPSGDVVYYGNKDARIASLDRDDQGSVNDTIVLEDGTVIKVEENWENIAIRQKYPGEFVVNILMFNKKDLTVTPVKVKVEQLNPYKTIYAETVRLSLQKEEVTVIRFTLDSKGKVVSRSQAQEYLSPMLGGFR